MTVTKKGLVFSALLGLASIGAAAPAGAQTTLNEIGRMLQNQVLPQQPGRPDAGRERDAYERGRQDQAERMRQDERRRDDMQRAGNDRRRYDDGDRRRYDEADRRQRDYDRDQDDARRRWADDQRGRAQGRY